MTFGWFALGRWVHSFAECCSLSDSQPDPASSENLNRFITAYALLAVTSLIALTSYPPAIIAHLYPEVIISEKDHIVHTTEIRDDMDELGEQDADDE